MRTCNISVKQFNLNVKIAFFNQSMFYRFQCQTSVTRCRFHTKRKQEVENVLLRGLPIMNLKLLVTEGHTKTFAKLSGSVAKGYSVPVKFHCLFYLQVTVSFLAVEFTTRSHSRDQSGLFYKRATIYFRSKTCFR